VQFKVIVGQEAVKQKLVKSVAENRVAHSQLFLGAEGSGALALAIAYAQYLNCTNKQEDDSCGKCPSCVKYEKLAHPDLHFIFPTTTTEKVKKEPESILFADEWRNYLLGTKAYATQSGWYDYLGVGNKQGTIYARDANHVIKKLGLKSYEAGYKVVLIYLAEKLHPAASNKLLKSLEEPPDKTLIVLVSEHYELILPTIRSRAQLIKIPKLSASDLEGAILSKFAATKLTLSEAKRLADMANGNWNQAQELMDEKDEDEFNFLKFREWMRLCFRPANYFDLYALIQEISRLGREKQKRFLAYGLKVIHNSLIVQQGMHQEVTARREEEEYFVKFAPFINQANRKEIYELLNESVYHIERNAHPGILFTDLSFHMINLLKLGKSKAIPNK